jgi:hypothetical protein
MDYRPCINCRRFHWGMCNNQARTCWTCGGLGHIQRYCPRKTRRKAPRGELHPGTSSWCKALGLDDDPLLKSNITSTLKEYPGATIFLNDECIYRGVQTYFYRKALPQGPDLAERLRRPTRVGPRRYRSRSRSRSPSRERVLKRSRSPLGRYSRGNSPEIVEDGRYDVGHSTSPIINTYKRRSVTSIIDLTDIEMVSPPRPSRAENIPPVIVSFTSTGKRPSAPIPRATPSRSLPSSRLALGVRSGNIPLPSVLDWPINENPTPPPASGTIGQMEDPHFVLGISKGAREAEYVPRSKILQNS